MQKIQEAPKKNFVVFRLKRSLDETENNIILLEDRPKKRLKRQMNQMLQSFDQIKLADKPKQKPWVQPQLKFLRKINIQDVEKQQSQIDEACRRFTTERNKNLRQQIIKALRGQSYDSTLMTVQDIDKKKFIIMNGKKIPYKQQTNQIRTLVPQKYAQDYYVYETGQLKMDQQYPALQCPQILDSDLSFDNGLGRSRQSFDSQDSNDEDHPDNDYPEEESSNSNGRDSQYDEQQFQYDDEQDFSNRIRQKKAYLQKQEADYSDDDYY